MDMPPTRLRVIERGRRLEVIDTGAARPVAAPIDRIQVDRAPARSLPRTVKFDGTREWTTHPLYDARGPRLVRVGPGQLQGVAIAAMLVAAVAVAILIFAPWLLLGLAAVLNPKVAKPAREAITRWLDRIAV